MPFTTLLTCHPESLTQFVHRIEVTVRWTKGQALALRYVLKADSSRLKIPGLAGGRRSDRLWEHTCYEVFIAVDGKPEYCELNFSPSGEWAAYAFRAYRDGMPLKDEKLRPSIDVRSATNGFELDAVVHLDRLPVLAPGASLRLGLAAVIEENNGTLSYWALKHRPGKPDFHHPDAFALRMGPEDVAASDKAAYTAKG